jgi:Ubiquitin carboxyl-terminal hydrolase
MPFSLSCKVSNIPPHALHLICPIALNTPNEYRLSLQPIDIIKALSGHNTGKQNSLFSSREHQDAQELFQLLSECIKDETAAIDEEGHRDRGLGGLSQSKEITREIGKSVFDGLTANRRSCMECGYTEAVMHFALDNWQLAVPRLAVSVVIIYAGFFPPQRTGQLEFSRLPHGLHKARGFDGLYLPKVFIVGDT